MKSKTIRCNSCMIFFEKKVTRLFRGRIYCQKCFLEALDAEEINTTLTKNESHIKQD